MTPDERKRILKAMGRIQPDIARSWETIFATFPPTRVRLLEERFKEEAHFLGIPVRDFHRGRPVGRNNEKGDVLPSLQEAWRLVERRRQTDPEWAMEWSIRLNRARREEIPQLLQRMEEEVYGANLGPTGTGA